MFQEITSKPHYVELEQKVLQLWKERQVFEQSMGKDAPKGDYVFYEGPPTANGKPGIHHVISRCYKDLFPRFKTMQGHHVYRKGGWDTHGLPVEIEIEKSLGLSGKQDIERYGIAAFNKLAKDSVFSNIQDWNWMTERIGFWVDLEEAYVTYHNDYIESCWWVMKSLWERGLLFEDYKVNMHCPRCNTSLASHEVAQGYEENVDDPSVWPKFPVDVEGLRERGIANNLEPKLEGREVYMLAWTTTPWTLAANSGLAVRADASYALVEAAAQDGSEENDLYILAEQMLGHNFGEAYSVLERFQGAKLEGLKYRPILQGRVPKGEDISTGFRVITDDFVEIDPDGEGTGVVHIAPAYGDLELGKAYGLPTLFSVDLVGEVFPEVKANDDEGSEPGPYAGQFFKQADKAISRDLLARNLMFRRARIKHTYPFCWRCKTPLLFYAKSAWYLRTTAIKDKLVANNEAIFWVPEHIRGGRFGKWLENNIDWALSRERYWGCPLPMWISEDGKDQHCIGSIAELAELTGRDLSDLELHRPYVDDISFEKDGKTFHRVPYTVDVWFESGAMPYAQWHYLGENSSAEEQANFERHFPADYICEAIDQTRGWFYSLHALASLMTFSGNEQIPPGPLAHMHRDISSYKNVICLGHILDEKGEKMSKSKGNIVEPEAVLNKQGADALRWYLYSAAPPGNSRRFSAKLVDETQSDFFATLWNSYYFFTLYANLDKPNLRDIVPVAERTEIDRWLIARLNMLARDVTAGLEQYDPTPVCRMIRDFVVDELSNWYVRRNRKRFWRSENDGDKQAAYQTLYESLVTVAKLIAPMAPFISETMYQNLVLSLDGDAPTSVHLAAWPEADEALIDQRLVDDMQALLTVIALGRSARNASSHKIRQPLPEVLMRVAKQSEYEGIQGFEDHIREELNVKAVRYLDITADFVNYNVRPNLPLVGKRVGKKVPALRKALANIDGKAIARNIREQKASDIELDGEVFSFEPEAFLLDAQSPEGFAAAEQEGYLAALNTQLTPELIQEGYARDCIRFVQEARKNAGLDVSDTIHLSLSAEGELAEAIQAFADSICKEVLAVSLDGDSSNSPHQESVSIADFDLGIGIQKQA